MLRLSSRLVGRIVTIPKLATNVNTIPCFRKFSTTIDSESESPNLTADQESIVNYRKEHSIRFKGVEPGDEFKYPPITNFEHNFFPLPIKNLLLKAGYTEPTPIQAQAWPIALDKRDMISVAKTGSGKTCAYLIPAIKDLFMNKDKNAKKKVSVLVLSPTRELCNQIMEQVTKYTAHYSIGINALACYGGSDRNKQIRALQRNNIQIIVGTPGRCNDLMEAGVLNLNDIKYCVLDEADRMLDMGFEPQIQQLLNETDPNQRQTLCFTATWPKEVQRLAMNYLKDPVQLNIGESDLLTANNKIEQNIHFVSERDKYDKLSSLLNEIKEEFVPPPPSESAFVEDVSPTKHMRSRSDSRNDRFGRGAQRYEKTFVKTEPKVIIFTSRKASCDDIVFHLNDNGYRNVNSLHGDKSQNNRDRVMQSFRKGYCSYLVATDVAARGLDINDIDVVINIDMPQNIEDYVHRIGRTARGNSAKGVAHTFFSMKQDYKLAKPLVDVMERSRQVVPNELVEYVGTLSARRGGGIGNKGGRGGDRRDRGSFSRYDSRGYGDRRGHGGGYGERGRGGGYSDRRGHGGGYDRSRDDSGRGGGYGDRRGRGGGYDRSRDDRGYGYDRAGDRDRRGFEQDRPEFSSFTEYQKHQQEMSNKVGWSRPKTKSDNDSVIDVSDSYSNSRESNTSYFKKL